MKKACIFTFHNVPNYGAVLQTYALSNYIEKNMDYHVDVIDFMCKGNGEEFKPSEFIKIASKSGNKIVSIYKKVMLSLCFEKDYKSKYLKFQAFKRRNLSVKPYDKEYMYDVVIVGSDQIWNPDITDGFQTEFFGESRLVKCDVKIAYAASCGDISAFTGVQAAELVERVSQLNYIGVREKCLSEFLLEKGIKNICTLDPTFLLSSEEYDYMVKDSSQIDNAYVLVYELQKNKEMEKFAFKIAKEKNIGVRILVGHVSYLKKKPFEIRDAGPVEFLSLVKDADYIITNSFHGTVFSLIYKKDFNVFLPKARTSRVVDLLSEIGLMSRIIGEGAGELNCEHINYSSIETNIKRLEVLSKRFLQEALGGVVD